MIRLILGAIWLICALASSGVAQTQREFGSTVVTEASTEIEAGSLFLTVIITDTVSQSDFEALLSTAFNPDDHPDLEPVSISIAHDYERMNWLDMFFHDYNSQPRSSRIFRLSTRGSASALEALIGAANEIGQVTASSIGDIVNGNLDSAIERAIADAEAKTRLQSEAAARAFGCTLSDLKTLQTNPHASPSPRNLTEFSGGVGVVLDLAHLGASRYNYDPGTRLEHTISLEVTALYLADCP